MFDDIMIYLNCLSNQRFTRQFMCVNLCFSYIILKNVVSLNFFIVLFFVLFKVFVLQIEKQNVIILSVFLE